MTRFDLTLGTLVLCASALTACDGGGEYVKHMEEFAEKTCACKDAECTTKVAKEQADWLTANADKAAKLSSDDAEKVGAAGTKMAECATKIATEAAGAAMPYRVRRDSRAAARAGAGQRWWC
jgi:hypothetical protein